MELRHNANLAEVNTIKIGGIRKVAISMIEPFDMVCHLKNMKSYLKSNLIVALVVALLILSENPVL